MSAAAVNALGHIARARRDIEDGDEVSFARELGEVGILLDIVEAMLPTSIAKCRIWVARKQFGYEDTLNGQSRDASIYGLLVQLASNAPQDDGGQHRDDTSENLAVSNTERAMLELEAVAGALDCSETDLSLQAARRLLARAKSEMQQANPQAAEDALRVAEDHIVFLSVAMHEPLAEAHQSMWHAMRTYPDSSHRTARSEIRRAARYLEYSLGGADDEACRILEDLIYRARSLETKIQAGDEDVPMRLRELWGRTRALSARSAAYFAKVSEGYGEDSEFKANLIEAKLHLSFAEIDHLILKDASRAQNEIDKAREYLSKAAAHAPRHEAPEINALRSGVGELSLRQTHDQLNDRYTDLGRRLRNQLEKF